jgi:hypothetical protein
MRFVKVSFNGISTEEMQRRLYPAYTQPWVQNKPKQHKGNLKITFFQITKANEMY